jgi:DNA-binding protein YbaB
MSQMMKQAQQMQNKMSAVNQVINKLQDEAQNRMNAVTGNILGNIKVPGL